MGGGTPVNGWNGIYQSYQSIRAIAGGANNALEPVPTWGSADVTFAGGGIYNTNWARIRERIPVGNLQVALLAGMPQIEIMCSSGSNGLVARIQGVMHYHINAPKTHPNIDWHKVNVPIPLTNHYLTHQVAAVGGVGTTVKEAIQKTRTLAHEQAVDPVAKAVLAHPLTRSVSDARVPTTVSQVPVGHKGFLASLWGKGVGAVESIINTFTDVVGSVGGGLEEGAKSAAGQVGRWLKQKVATEGASMAEQQLDAAARSAFSKYGYESGATVGRKRARYEEDIGTGYRGSGPAPYGP
jgi:hypothetical protein